MRVGIISDDLTGTNSIGVQMAKQGLYSQVQLDLTKPFTSVIDAAVCIDTDSRYLPQEEARLRVSKAMALFQKWGADLICKRIDSTFRGNIGPEIDAMFEMLDSNVIGIIVPSFPDANRSVVGGCLSVDGVQLNNTDVASDPVNPLLVSYLPYILSKQTELDIDLVKLYKVNLGASAISGQLKAGIENGTRLFICDAETTDHIESISESMIQMEGYTIIPIDSGSLTESYVRKLRNKRNSSDKDKLLISVGSVTSNSSAQIQFLINQLHIDPVYVDSRQLVVNDKTSRDEIERAVSIAYEQLKKNSVVLITTNLPESNLVDLNELSHTKGVSKDVLAKKITGGLAEISKSVVRKANGKIKGCFFSGGDMTASFCETVNANGIALLEEVMPLVAYGKLLGGEFDGLSIVSKGGLVGGEEAIYACVEFLKKI